MPGIVGETGTGPIGPRRTRGGIRAQSGRPGVARRWWARRWIEALESAVIGGRLGRARSYARGGQVRSIEIGRGKVVAFVQGSRPDPYKIVIRVRVLTPEKWAAVGRALARNVVFAARLLGGEMPEGIEDAFTEAGVTLFPNRRDDLETECSCPDEANPCKHIAAVHFLLAEEFDRDPFLIFRLRGMSRDELSEILAAAGATRRALKAAEAPRPEKSETDAPLEGDPLPAGPEAYWGELDPKDPDPMDPDPIGPVRIPAVNAALIKRLGSFPFWRGERPFIATLERVYGAASQAGLSVFLGESEFAPAAEEVP